MAQHAILLDGPLAGQRIRAALKTRTYQHRDATGGTTMYRLDWTTMFRCHVRVGWSGPEREAPELGCARWLTSEVVKEYLDEMWRGSGVEALTAGERAARAEYEANAAIPPIDPPVDHESLGEVVRRAEKYMQARRRAHLEPGLHCRDGKVAEALVLDDLGDIGQGFTPLWEDDLVALIAVARGVLAGTEEPRA